jgi:hypothetical protein
MDSDDLWFYGIGIMVIIALTFAFGSIIKMQLEQIVITCDTLHSLDMQLYGKNISTCDQSILYRIGNWFYQREPDTIAYKIAREEATWTTN